MTNFLQLLFAGVSLGALYALLALGFVMIYRATDVVNFAHGGLVILGAFVMSLLGKSMGMSFPIALAAGIVAAGVAAVAIERFLVRPMGVTSVVATGIMTIGVDIVLQTEITRRIGTEVRAQNDPWGASVIQFGGLTLPQTRVWALVIAALLLVAFFTWFKMSSWGVAMRAASADPTAASLMGIKLGRVSTVAWLIAGVLAAIAGLFLTISPTPGLEASTSATALRAFPAAILGGLNSTTGALVGGIVIGVAETMVAGYGEHLHFLGGGSFSRVIPYVVMVAVLLYRPTGLFGSKEVHRV